MKKVKKLFAGLLTAAMLAGSAQSGVLAAATAPWTYPTTIDFTQYTLEAGQLRGLDTADTNAGIYTDPTNPGNDVYGLKTSSNNRTASQSAVMYYTDKAVQFDFDIYREDTSAEFYIRLYANQGGTSGSQQELFRLDNAGNIKAGSNIVGSYSPKTWYSFRIRTNMAKTYHELYVLDGSSYKLLGSVSNNSLGFSSSVRMNYFMINVSKGWTYLDNMKWTELGADVKKKIHYDFNDVKTVNGVVQNSNFFFDGASSGFTQNATDMTFEQAEFGGEQVLKTTMKGSTGTTARTWASVPDMDKVVVSARIGYNREGELEKNLPLQLGIKAIFNADDGSKGVNARKNESSGILYDPSGAVNMEGSRISKNAGEGTELGYYIEDGRLYDLGYAYDREQKKLKAYFITNKGETIVKDVSNAHTNAGKNIAGISLVSASDNTYLSGKGYFDYLYVDEAENFVAESITPANGSGEVNLMPEIKVNYNYVIDPQNLGAISLKDQQGNDIEFTAKTYNGKTLVIKPSQKLESACAYTVTVSGVKDLIGQEQAEAITASFTTGAALKISDVVLNDGGNLIDGDNKIELLLESNDGSEYTVSLVAAIYDKGTNELLGANMVQGTVPASGAKDFELTCNTAEYSNYYMNVFAWSGFGTMIPYTAHTTFEK